MFNVLFTDNMGLSIGGGVIFALGQDDGRAMRGDHLYRVATAPVSSKVLLT
jgi:hypothetical protein